MVVLSQSGRTHERVFARRRRGAESSPRNGHVVARASDFCLGSRGFSSLTSLRTFERDALSQIRVSQACVKVDGGCGQVPFRS